MDDEYFSCHICGFQNPVKNSFCARCGEVVPRVAETGAVEADFGAGADGKAEAYGNSDKCPKCGFENTPYTDFCDKCGLPLTDDFTVDDQGDIAVIVFNMEQFDFESNELLRPIVNSVDRKKVVLDVSNVKWMDSTGIGTIVSVSSMLQRNHRQMKVVGVNGNILSAMRSMQIDSVVELSESVEACRAEWGLLPKRITMRSGKPAAGRKAQ